MNKLIVFLLCFAGLLAVSVIYANEPATNISPLRHPNLARAQELIGMAYQKIVDAQAANEFDLGGHAAKAKSLLDDASKELKQAAEEANANKGGVKARRPLLEKAPTKSYAESKHPNLARAQDLLDRAYLRIMDAQKMNDFDMEGHAAKAKGLLEQATKELKLAAVEATEK